MYGISKNVTAASEKDFQLAFARLDRITAAIEQLNEIEKAAGGGLTQANNKLNEGLVTSISEEFSEEIGAESFDDVVQGAKNIVRKLIAYAMSIIEKAYDTVKSHKFTADRLFNRAVKVIGMADTAKRDSASTNIQYGFASARISVYLDIAGKVPDNIEKYILDQLAVSRKLGDLNIGEDVYKLSAGAVSDEDKIKIGKEILSDINDNCKNAFGSGRETDGVVRYSHAPLPGNFYLVAEIPKDTGDFSKYSVRIEDNKVSLPDKMVTKPLGLEEILSIARSTKVFCSEVRDKNRAFKTLESISRSIKNLERSKDPKEASESIKHLAKIINTPYMVHARMCLTLCSRAIIYCEESAKLYN